MCINLHAVYSACDCMHLVMTPVQWLFGKTVTALLSSTVFFSQFTELNKMVINVKEACLGCMILALPGHDNMEQLFCI